MIKHFPITNIDKVIEHYSQKNNVPITYVCTTDLNSDDSPADIFYRETPHPDFGNKYFSIRIHNGKTYIGNADDVEKLTFGMVEDNDGDLQYSQFHHYYNSLVSGNMIDGGRSYIRSSGKVVYYNVRNGRMIQE